MPQAPRDVLEVDPDTRGQENPISTSTDESTIGITFLLLFLAASTAQFRREIREKESDYQARYHDSGNGRNRQQLATAVEGSVSRF